MLNAKDNPLINTAPIKDEPLLDAICLHSYALKYAATFEDFKEWIEAIYKREAISNIAINHGEVQNVEGAVALSQAVLAILASPKLFEHHLKNFHLSKVSSKAITDEMLYEAGITVMLTNAAEAKYVLYLTAIYNQKKSLVDKLPEFVSRAVADNTKLLIDAITYNALGTVIKPSTDQQRINSLEALIQAYPQYLCHFAINITNRPTLPKIGQDIVIAADITLQCNLPLLASRLDQLHTLLERSAEQFTNVHLLNNARSRYEKAVNTFQSACNMPQKASADKAAKEKYVCSYIAYYKMCFSIMSRWTLNNAQLSNEVTLHILSFIDNIDWTLHPTHSSINQEVIQTSPRLRLGGDLHNLMITSTISQCLKNQNLSERWQSTGTISHGLQNLKPSCEESARWKCVIACLNQDMSKLLPSMPSK